MLLIRHVMVPAADVLMTIGVDVVLCALPENPHMPVVTAVVIHWFAHLSSQVLFHSCFEF